MNALARNLLSLGLVALIAGCTPQPMAPASTNLGGTSTTTQGATPAPPQDFSFSGRVTIPAGLISNNAGGLISNNAGGLISNNAGGLISNNAGGLIANNSGSYRVAALAEVPLTRALVYFLNLNDTFYQDEQGRQMLTMTDDQGAYGLTVRLSPNVPVIVSALVTGNRRMVGYTMTRAGEKAVVNIGIASTYVTEYLREQASGNEQILQAALPLLPQLVSQTQVLLDLGLLPVPDLTIGHAWQMNRTYATVFASRSKALSDLWKQVLGRRVLAITTPAGNYLEAMDQDPAPDATKKGLAYPTGVAVDATGTLYVACQTANVIRRVAPDGSVTVIGAFRGDGTMGFTPLNYEAFTDAGLPFNQIVFSSPQDVACDQDGNVMVTCKEWGLLIFLCQKTGRYFQKDMVAGRGYMIGDHGPDFQYDEYGSYYDTNSAHPDWPAEYLDGPIHQARFRSPHGLCADAHGNFYVADRRNNLIRRINRDDGQVITLAGPLVAGSDGLPPEVDQLNGTDDNDQYLWDGKAAEVEPATASHLYRPFDVAWRSLPNGQEELYIWEGYNPDTPPGSPMVTGGNAIRVLSFSESNLTGGTVRTVAGGPDLVKGDAPDGAVARNASLYLVDGVSGGDIPDGGLAMDPSMRYLYLADTNNKKIKVIDLGVNPPTISTLVGGGTVEKNVETQDAKLSDVSGLAVDAWGNVYFCDNKAIAVRKVTLQFGRD